MTISEAENQETIDEWFSNQNFSVYINCINCKIRDSYSNNILFLAMITSADIVIIYLTGDQVLIYEYCYYFIHTKKIANTAIFVCRSKEYVISKDIIFHLFIWCSKISKDAFNLVQFHLPHDYYFMFIQLVT